MGKRIMKISQKRTCNGCIGQALNCCELNFSSKPVYKNGTRVGDKPLEPCPKPLTLNDYHTAWLEMDAKRNSQP